HPPPRRRLPRHQPRRNTDTLPGPELGRLDPSQPQTNARRRRPRPPARLAQEPRRQHRIPRRHTTRHEGPHRRRLDDRNHPPPGDHPMTTTTEAAPVHTTRSLTHHIGTTAARTPVAFPTL